MYSALKTFMIGLVLALAGWYAPEGWFYAMLGQASFALGLIMMMFAPVIRD